MKERPILFSGPMVRAILDGKKSQTRRLVALDTLGRSETPGYDWTWRGQAPIRSIAQQRRHQVGCWQDVRDESLMSLCPYGAVGDRLWVKETWRVPPGHFDLMSPREIPHHTPIRYEVDGVVHGGADRFVDRNGLISIGGRVRQSIFMMRWASRITLEVTDVRVERLKSITEGDAIAEGVDPYECPSGPARPCARSAFAELWDRINSKRAPWASDPWVWKISFRRVTP